MKKAIAAVLALLMILAALTACSGDMPVDTSADTAPKTTDGNAAVTEPSTDEEPAGPASGEVVSLRVNYEKEPNCIDDTPVFSWATESTVRGTYQKSYRITVAKSETALKSGDLVWDSGEVNSDESVNIKYGGTLEASRRYFWRVTVTTGSGEKLVSAPSSFETGLREEGFSGAAWISQNGGGSLTDAHWIWNYAGNEHGKIPEGTQYFRYSFDLDGSKKIASALMSFTADDYGKAYLNGELAIDKPNVTDGWKSGAVIDVTNKLADHNVIAAYAVNTGVGYAGVIAKIAITYEDGSADTVVTSADGNTAIRSPTAGKNPPSTIRRGDRPTRR